MKIVPMRFETLNQNHKINKKNRSIGLVTEGLNTPTLTVVITQSTVILHTPQACLLIKDLFKIPHYNVVQRAYTCNYSRIFFGGSNVCCLCVSIYLPIFC